MVINNRGFWRILEASIAIFLLAATFMLLFISNDIQSEKEDISITLRNLLDEIAKDKILRETISTQSEDVASQEIMIFLEERFPYSELSYGVAVCNLDQEICGDVPEVNGNIYVEERFIAGTLETFRPQRLRIIAWDD